MIKDKNKLLDRYKYSAGYIDDYDKFYQNIMNKTIVPYQVEFQPPPTSINKICWLECPYCYGLSADDNGDRMQKDRAIEIMHQIAKGGVKKVIFAGYATDPLNCPYIEDLLEIAIDNKMIFGFNTKIIALKDRMIELLSRGDIVYSSYMSLSIDAGSNEAYNLVHGVKSKAKLYDKVLQNVQKLGEANRLNNNKLDLSAAYLINVHNNQNDEVKNFIDDFKKAGCNILRFTFPQPPKGINTDPGVVPDENMKNTYLNKLTTTIKNANDENCMVLIADADTKHDIFFKPRTLPCFARFIYPTIGFDGWLYHCSQSSSPNFRPMALGDLNKDDFWDLFYNYDIENQEVYFKTCESKMKSTGCRCDRKMHVTNQSVIKSMIFNK
jgi:sulfatase maturation enzyme AslB (radical SAM superfamily)